MTPVLSVRDLVVEFSTSDGPVRAVDRASFDVAPHEVLGIVGESGSGKSVTMLALMGLLPAGKARITAGQVLLNGREIGGLSQKALSQIRGRDMAMIFQDPMTALNPVLRVGMQLAEMIALHQPQLSRAQMRDRVIELLGLVGVPDPARRYRQYPHEFSGGMRQRVVIALALCAEPKLVVADEPTTALDVSIQAQVISLLKSLARDHGTSMMLVTHDMGVIAETADRVAVMYAGRIVEIGSVRDVVRHAAHPYSAGLMSSIPPVGRRLERMQQIDGSMPRLSAIPPGCAYNPRCPKVFDRCRVERPELMPAGDSHAACWLFAKEAAHA